MNATAAPEQNIRLHAYIVGRGANYGNVCSTPGNTVHLVNALNHIVRAKDSAFSRPHVVNISVIAPGQDALLEGAIQAMLGMGYTFVVGAGNDQVTACSQTPARPTRRRSSPESWRCTWAQTAIEIPPPWNGRSNRQLTSTSSTRLHCAEERGGRLCSPNLLVSVWVPGYMSIARKIQPMIQMILQE